MFLLFFPLRVIGIVATSYALCVALMHELIRWKWPNHSTDLESLALGGGSALSLMLLVFVHWGWRKIWEVCPKLNDWLFPDLNGTWDMTIHYRKLDGVGEISATAVIKQNWLTMSMEVLARDSDSQTLAIVPKKDSESGRAQLFYFYRVIPKKTSDGRSEPYEGAASLRFFAEGTKQLSGNYYTSVATDGHFKLIRQ
ncbi:hypothetical protein ACVK1X_005698 [Pseudomonas sp. PvR086]